MTNFWSKAALKKKSKVTNESLSTISQEDSESVTINDKTNPQPSTEYLFPPPKLQFPPLLKRKFNKKKNTKSDMLVDLCEKRDLGPFTKSP